MWVIRLRTLYVCIERSIGADLIIGEVLLKNFTFIYSLLANVFLRTYLQRAIQFPVVPKPIHQNVRHIVMLFFDELPLVNANYVLQSPSTPVFTYGERLLEKARVLSC